MLLSFALLTGTLGLTACGGGGAGALPGGGGAALELLAFEQEGLDNVALNTTLVFHFSAPVDPATVTAASLQFREGGVFGLPLPGTFTVEGHTVRFEPQLPGRCDLSDSAFKPDTTYRVVLVGAPEQSAIRAMGGRSLSATTSRDFQTRDDTAPGPFLDQVPAAAPSVIGSAPSAGAEAVAVRDGNRVVLTLSENIQPCTVSDVTVRFHIHQIGDAAVVVDAEGGAGRPTGFATDADQDTSDQTPGDPYTWTTSGLQAGVRTLGEAQKILAHVELQQSSASTQLVVTPILGNPAQPLLARSRFPENALVVLELTSGLQDYGGQPLEPFVMAFTTENLPIQHHAFDVDTRGETPWDRSLTTARVIETGAGRVQGFLLFAGDGDNGGDALQPSLPHSDDGTCQTPYQVDDGTLDDFDPSADVLLDTGSTLNTCPNTTDGSFAVVWEFNSLRIRNGVTVRIVGRNPALLLVQGDAVIEAGGRLLARGDGEGGAPQSDGEGGKRASTTAGTRGGIGVAGGGLGGSGPSGAGSFVPPRLGGHGAQGYYHASDGTLAGDVGTRGVRGAGHGNISARWNEQSNPNNRNTPSGGGAGHAAAGDAGTALGSGSTPTSLDGDVDGAAGRTYGEASGRMRMPEAGSGGGAGGELRTFSSTVGRGPGGAGGGGGGFVDLTAGGNITVLGTIDAAGGAGGSNADGAFTPNYAWNPGTGGGGGGSGGGIRLLTPGDIVLQSSTVLTAAGGLGGAGGASQGTNPPLNDGGDGGAGRIVLEDGDSVITGLGNASVTPSEGAGGFFRGVFDGDRFQGGGLTPVAVSDAFAIGVADPTYVTPLAADVVAFAPLLAVAGAGKTVMLIEARGYEMLPDATPDVAGAVAPPTPWHTVAYLRDTGVEATPRLELAQPPLADVGGALPEGNTGVFGIANLSGREFIQLRITMFLKDSIGAADPGHALDLWTIRVTSDQ